jgi:hypothetical protein
MNIHIWIIGPETSHEEIRELARPTLPEHYDMMMCREEMEILEEMEEDDKIPFFFD